MRPTRRGNFSIERLYEDVRGALPTDIRADVWTCRRPSTGLFNRLADIFDAARAQADVNHVTGDVHYLTYLLDKRRTVLTVHDLVSLNRLTGIKRWLLWLLWYWLPVQRASKVVVISEHTRNELLTHVTCDPNKIHIIHNCVSAEFKPHLRTFNASNPRILQMGTGPSKNLERVAAALAGIPCRLIVIGALSRAQIDHLQAHGIDYENYTNLSRLALLQQYIEADLLVFASTYEGFGLPIVEAHAVGRPVVTSNTASMPEVAGKAACFVDPLSIMSIRAAVERVVLDADYREALIQAGWQNARRFSASHIAGQYSALYRSLAGASN